MARNRKNESAAARFAPALKALLLCAFFVTAGVGYVWYKNQTKILGDELRTCQGQLSGLIAENRMLQGRLDAKRLPAALELEVKRINEKLNVGLVPSVPKQIIYVSDKAPEPLSSAEASRIATENRQARSALMERGD